MLKLIIGCLEEHEGTGEKFENVVRKREILVSNQEPK